MVAVPGDRETRCRQMNLVAGPTKRAADYCQKKAEQQQQKHFLLNGASVTQEHDCEILMSHCNQRKQKSPEIDKLSFESTIT
jgi:hypothetical protein